MTDMRFKIKYVQIKHNKYTYIINIINIMQFNSGVVYVVGELYGIRIKGNKYTKTIFREN
jgi:hypothetical protein